jgi:pyruvate dehydrogenase E2 component (dihydrolipoamide acetyltransferase)
MGEFCMPSLGADMQAGTLLEWKVKPGDRVRRGDIIAVVDTDKAAIEVESFESGVVEQLLIQPGAKVPVGTVMAIIRSEPMAPRAETVAPVAAEPPAARAAVEPRIEPGVMEGVATVPRPPLPPPVAARGGRVKASPLARRLAAEFGIELSTVRGTGPDGAIGRADVESAAAGGPTPGAAAPPPLPEAKAPPADYQAGMRRAIAAAMARSNREIPHYYLETRIDMSRALHWLEAENLKRSIKERMLPVVLLIKAVARALSEVPELNGYWIEDRCQAQEAINIGFAISLRQGGLITPALLGVDTRSPDEVMEAMRDLITRTRAGRLRSSELTDATITVTSLGDLGVETVFGVIYPPQVALVGFGKITERPWAESGMLGIRPVVMATLAGDHRATDGRRGAQFLDALNRFLQEPASL